MSEYYFSPQYLDDQISRAKCGGRSGAVDPVQHALELEEALDALCRHLGVVLIRDVRKRWVTVPAQREGAFVYGGE